MSRPFYEHTQTGWLLRLSFVFGAVLCTAVGAATPPPPSPLPIEAFMAIALLMLVLGWFWASLTVRVEEAGVRVRFGLGWPRRTLPVADLANVEITRTSWLSGWGMHLTRRGWLYNVSGCDAVIVGLKSGKAVLIGSDEPRRLKAAIERAMAAAVRTPAHAS